MEKQLSLYGNYGKYDEASFIVAEGEKLIVKVVDKVRANVQYYATIQKDGVIEKLSIIDNLFEIPNKFLTFGALSVTISLYFKGGILKEFVCEQLIIKELNNEKTLIPEIVELKNNLIEMNSLLIDNLANFKLRIEKNEELMAFLCKTNVELKGEQDD